MILLQPATALSRALPAGRAWAPARQALLAELFTLCTVVDTAFVADVLTLPAAVQACSAAVRVFASEIFLASFLHFDTALLEGADLADGLRQAAEHMLKVALTPEALALHRMVITEARRFPKLAHVLHELGAAAGVERIARHLETRIANGEMRGVDPRFAAEQFILMVVTGPQRRALGLGAPLTAAALREWVDDTVELFLRGCGGSGTGAAN